MVDDDTYTITSGTSSHAEGMYSHATGHSSRAYPSPCYFCDSSMNVHFNFQGKNMCSECDIKLSERIKLILKFQ